MVVLRYAYVLALVVWVGGLIAAGAFVAPALFGVLQAEAGATGRVLAGAAFGEILRRVLLAGEAAGGMMFVTMTILRLLGPKPLSYGIRALLIGAMLAVNAYTAHIVLPETDGLRREMAGPVTQIAADDPRRVRFDHLHSLSTTLVMGIALAGIGLAAWEARE
ncbi:MAG TPA: DUF4149 domain-containing protein [Vicinamibacterales bacterium]|nr:DUF4149 domain-containing protein [Vicinamibacterales bacterium]